MSAADGKLHDVTSTNLPQVVDFSHGSTAADVDGDGDIDIWVNNLGGEHSYLLLNDGKGDFSVAASLGEPCCDQFSGTNGRLPEELVGMGGLWAQFVDAENDGDPDLYLGLVVDTNRTWLLLNDGNGFFTDAGIDAIPPRTFGGVAQAEGSAVRDINADGFNDLLLLESPFNDGLGCTPDFPRKRIVAILISNGDGTFRDETFLRTPQTEDCKPSGAEFKAADLNRDGAVEIISQTFPENEILLNNGFGFFSSIAGSFIDVEGRNSEIGITFNFATIDADGDGDTDFIEYYEPEDEISLIKASNTIFKDSFESN